MFEDFETSESSGQIVQLFQYTYGAAAFYVTSADQPVVYDGDTYTPYPCGSGALVQGANGGSYDIETTTEHPVVSLFADSQPATAVWMTERRIHPADPDGEAAVYFVGKVAAAPRDDGLSSATIRHVPTTTMLATAGLRLSWDRNCPYCVYDTDCGLDPADFQTPATVGTVGAFDFTTTADVTPAAGGFAGGIVEWDTPDGTTERRGVESYDGTTVTLLGRTKGLAPGDTVRLALGCARTYGACQSVFNNLKQCGGFEFMPGETPFGETTVF